MIKKKNKTKKTTKHLCGRLSYGFIFMLAHQLKTQFSSIKWTLDSVIKGDLGPISEEQKDYLVHCYEGNERIINLTNEMLDYDHLMIGKFKYSFFSIKLSELINSVIIDVSAQAKEKNVSIRVDVNRESLFEVLVDVNKIRIVFHNFLDNAIKYTPAGGVITIGLLEEDGYIKVSISDTGIGIPANQQKNIFKNFFRAENATRIEKNGTGLGLFISKNFIEGHGGKIWFESKEDKGTTFYFTLPLNRQVVTMSRPGLKPRP